MLEDLNSTLGIKIFSSWQLGTRFCLIR